MNITATDLMLEHYTWQSLDNSVFYDSDSLFAGFYITESMVAYYPSKTGFGFVSMAQACSPVPNRALQWVTDISVISNSEFVLNENLSFTPGDTLNDLFFVSHVLNSFQLSVNEYVGQKISLPAQGQILRMNVDEPVDNEVALNCTFRFELSDGNVYQFPDVVMRIH